MALLFTSPPVGAGSGGWTTGAEAVTPPCWKMPRPRSWIHLAMSSESTPATIPTNDTVNGLSVEDVVACCTEDAIEKPAMAALGEDLPKAAVRPGLALLAENDPYLGAHGPVYRSAEAAGARVVPLAGVGHWWMLDDPSQGALALTAFWASLA